MISFCFLVVFSSCNTDSDIPSEDPLDELEEYDVPYLKDRLELDSGADCDIETPLIYEDKLILMITNNETGEGWINCYDKTTLEVLWTWREALDEFGSPARGFGRDSYFFDGLLCTEQNNLSYGIDINTGSTVWKNRDLESSESYITGFNEQIFSYQINQVDGYAHIRSAQILNGNWDVLFEMSKDDTLDVFLGSPLPFEWNEIEYLAFVSIKWGTGPHVQHNWLNLYNLTEGQMEWKSDTIPLQYNLSPTPGSLPVFEDGQILLANDALYSYNIEDGSLEWWKKYDHNFIYSSHILAAEGMVYGNNENQFFVGLDVHTGEEKFRTPTGGTASRIDYNDGKCYMSSLTVGGANHMMVIDAQTGEILQDEKAPFRDEDVEWIFDRAIAVDPETGYVYTGDHRYLLVYDFGE